MDFIINNKKIKEPIINIIKQLRKETNYFYFKDIINDGDNLKVTCPFHKDGREAKPACQIYQNYQGAILPGLTHCFACGVTATLPQVVNHCFNKELNDSFGESWISERYANIFIEQELDLPEIIFTKHKCNKQYIDENILNNYRYFHNYMWQRKLTPEIVTRFEVGYDPKHDVITFPVRDEMGGLVGITARNVRNKTFHIPKEMNKPVYLLYYVLKNNITKVTVTESQINALTLWGYNIPAVALFGTGSESQLNTLLKCGITHFILAFDGDDAGRKGAIKFINAFKQRSDILIDVIIVPENKDVNDLTEEQFYKLPIMSSVDYVKFMHK